jgi:hypothetical protein
MVAKEIELSRKNKGTFRRSAPRQKNRAKWAHTRFPGWLRLRRGMGEVVEIDVRAKKGGEWQLLTAILGFVDRHFGPKVRAVNIQYSD